MVNLAKMKIAFVSILAIAGFINNPALGWRQASSAAIADLPPAPDTGTPDGQRISGGTRRNDELTGACKQTDKLLTALVPENAKGLTTVEYPVFWFYIPYAPEDVHLIEFSLHDQNENTTIYRTSVQLPKTPGVIGISLAPNSKNSLKLNETYHWRLIFNCNPQTTPEDDIALDGWVTRVQPSPNQDIWYDELTNLANRYFSEPENTEVKNAWVRRLKSVGLEGLAQAPLVRDSKQD